MFTGKTVVKNFKIKLNFFRSNIMFFKILCQFSFFPFVTLS